jgi:hypothetical protein
MPFSLEIQLVDIVIKETGLTNFWEVQYLLSSELGSMHGRAL